MMNADTNVAKSEANVPVAVLITVAICTRNRAEFLEKAIRSVLPQLTPAAELIVVDNASTDNTRAVCEQLAKETGKVVYHFEPKLGLSTARNTSLRIACGQWVLFLDDDAMAEPSWLEAYRKFILNPPAQKIATVGGGVIPYYTSPVPRWYDLKNGNFDRGNKPLLLAGGGLAGGNSVYLREAVLGVGMYDERLGYKGNKKIPREETELHERLLKAGWQCWWLPGAAIRHHVAAERLTIWGMAGSAVNAGRGAAIHRLKLCANRKQRFWLRMERLIAMPFQMIVNSIQALFLFGIGKQAPAVGALCRVTRAVGWAWQLSKITTRNH